MPDTGLSDEDRKRLRDMEASVAALRERTHAQTNGQQRDASLVNILQGLQQAVSAISAKQEAIAVTAQTTAAAVVAKPAEQPMRPIDWLTKVWAPIGAILVVLITIATIFISYGRNDAAVLARVATLETFKLENNQLGSRVQSLENNADTARRIRDQQQQGFADRMRVLELADQSGSERINTVMQTLATITAQLQAQAARVEELLRRQDRLENRLGARGGSAEPEQPTGLHTWSLVYRQD